MPSQDVDTPPASPSTSVKTRGARPARRPGVQLPPWGNLLFGFLILGVGLYLTAVQKGPAFSATRIIFLVLYAGLAGLYFGRAYRQYRK
jgi:hypothetical protein